MHAMKTPVESQPDKYCIPASLMRCRRYTFYALVAVLLLVSAFLVIPPAWHPAPGTQILKLSGRIESEESHIASLVPFESMPSVLQLLSTLDPLRYFTLFGRASLLKGAGIELLWPYLLVLALSAALMLSTSTLRFARQLG